MFRRQGILGRVAVLGIALVVLGLVAGATTRRYARADSDPAGSAYYVVVLPPASGDGSSMQLVQVSSGGATSVQVASNGATVDCTRYVSMDDAGTAAAQNHPGASWTVELAPDALHAMLQAAGASPDLLTLLPALADADLCIP
jgi:hypothetical protein